MGNEFFDVEFLTYVIRALVNNPDDVKVDRSVDEMGVLLSVKVNPEDMGLIIGRAGSTAKAVRTITRIVGMREKARVNIRIVEPEGSTHVRRDPGALRPSKDRSVDDIIGEL